MRIVIDGDGKQPDSKLWGCLVNLGYILGIVLVFGLMAVTR